MSDVLARLPNYTCLQTTERSRVFRRGGAQLIDLVRMEVALVDGKELYAWPGSKNFDDTRIIDMVKDGAISNGNFAIHAKSVFESRNPQFAFMGERAERNGRRVLQWNFVVSQSSSGYTLRSRGEQAIVGYHGSFLADATTLDVIRLEIHADNIPKALQMEAASDVVEYALAALGEQSFLLPVSAELNITDTGGDGSRNRTTFSACRQYRGESKITFDDPANTASDANTNRSLEMPAGLLLDVALESPIEQGRAAVGDPITAILKKPVTFGDGLSAPKGAVLHGRITFLRHLQGATGWVVGLTFVEMEWKDTRAKLQVKLAVIPSLLQLTSRSPRYRALVAQTALEPDMFIVPEPRLSLTRGFAMQWRTDALPPQNRTSSGRP